MIDRVIFSERLKALKQAKNATSVSIADHLGIAKQSVHTWETMKTLPSSDKLVELADYFEVSIDYLVGRSDTPYILRSEDVELLSPKELEKIRKGRDNR